MATLWWQDEFRKMGTTGDATVRGFLEAIAADLPTQGYTIAYTDDNTVGATKGTTEVAVIYSPSGHTGTFGDGKPYMLTHRQVVAAADDVAVAEAVVNEVLARVNGIGFL